MRLPPHGGLKLTRTIRRNSDNENRTLPILLMSSDTSEVTVKNSRDTGANIVVAKPMSPSGLYDRLGWIVFNPRPFVDTANYFGPDRRFKIEGYPGGVGRRKGDKIIDVAAEEGPALGQDDIDSLFSNARTGQDCNVKKQSPRSQAVLCRHPLRAAWRGGRAASIANRRSQQAQAEVES